MSDILLTYGWVRSSYSALRNLTNHDLKVVVSDNSRIGMCQFSKLSSSVRKYTSHYQDENQFVEDLINICESSKVKMILPSHNETEIIAKYKHKFSPKLVTMVPDESHCRIFNNKGNAYDYVSSIGIPIPYRLQYSDPKTIAVLLKKKGLKKTVIKLLTGNSSKGVFYANSPKHAELIVCELIQRYKLADDRYPQIEEYIEGEGYGCSVLYCGGELIAGFTHRRLRDKVETGGTSTFREVAGHEGIEAATKIIFDSLGWNGLAMCEFKVCSETNRYWFIEVNPRMWGSISLAIESGVEFPYLAWLCAEHGPNAARRYHESCSLRTNWKARWLLGDIFVLLNRLRRLDFNAVFRLVNSGRADSLDDFFWDDPLAFVGEVLAYLKSTISKRSVNPAEDGMLR